MAIDTPPLSDPEQVLIHASCVAVEGRAVLILGAAGSGKSGLALQLMAYGAELVSDDQTILAVKDNALFATAPSTIAGLIEARGVGLLKVPGYTSASVVVVVDLDHEEAMRLPERKEMILAGVSVPVLHNVAKPHFPSAVLQYLKAGRRDPQ